MFLPCPPSAAQSQLILHRPPPLALFSPDFFNDIPSRSSLPLTHSFLSFTFPLPLPPPLWPFKGAASRSLIDALARLASLRPSLVLTHVLIPLLCQPAGSLGSVQCEAVARVIKQGCFGMGEEGSGGFGGRRGVYLEKLLRGLCGWDLSLNLGDECGNGAQERRSPEVVEEKESRGLEGNEKEGRSEERRGGGGLEHRRAML